MKQQLEHLKLTLGENPCDGLALLTLGDMLFHGKVDVQEHLTILEELQELLFAAHQPNGDPTKINTTSLCIEISLGNITRGTLWDCTCRRHPTSNKTAYNSILEVTGRM